MGKKGRAWRRRRSSKRRWARRSNTNKQTKSPERAQPGGQLLAAANNFCDSHTPHTTNKRNHPSAPNRAANCLQLLTTFAIPTHHTLQSHNRTSSSKTHDVWLQNSRSFGLLLEWTWARRSVLS